MPKRKDKDKKKLKTENTKAELYDSSDDEDDKDNKDEKKKRKSQKEDRENDPFYINLIDNIEKYKNDIWIPTEDEIKYTKINHAKTWFKMENYKSPEETKYKHRDIEYDDFKDCANYKTIKIKVNISINDQHIIDTWLKSYICMYNKTLHHIKKAYRKKEDGEELDVVEIERKIKNKIKYVESKETSLSSNILRTYFLKEDKDEITDYFTRTVDKKEISPYSHMLEDAIDLACANYKSMLSNLKNDLNNNNKKFKIYAKRKRTLKEEKDDNKQEKGEQEKIHKKYRIRYWRYNKKTQIMSVRKEFIKKSQIFPNILKDQIKYECNGEEYKNLEDLVWDIVNDGKPIERKTINDYISNSTLKREKAGEKYYLFIPLKLDKEYEKPKNKIISLDPGIRSFMTGISENEVLRIGNKVSERLNEEIKKLDYIKKRKKVRNKKENKKKIKRK